MSIVDKSRSEMIDELIEYEMGWLKQMSLDDYDDWVMTSLRIGLKGYEEMTEGELVVVYSALLIQRDKDLAEGGE